MYKYLLPLFFSFIIFIITSTLYAMDYTVSINIINLSEYNINASYNQSKQMGSWGLVGGDNSEIIGIGGFSHGINSFDNISEFNITWSSSDSLLAIYLYNTFLFINNPGYYADSPAGDIISIPNVTYHTIFVPNPRTTDSTYHEWYFKDTTDLIFAGVNANTIGGGLGIIAPNGQYWNQTTGIVVLYPELVGSTMQTELNNFFTENIIGTSSDSE